MKMPSPDRVGSTQESSQAGSVLTPLDCVANPLQLSAFTLSHCWNIGHVEMMRRKQYTCWIPFAEILHSLLKRQGFSAKYLVPQNTFLFLPQMNELKETLWIVLRFQQEGFNYTGIISAKLPVIVNGHQGGTGKINTKWASVKIR